VSDRGPGQELRLPQHGTGRRGRHLDNHWKRVKRKMRVQTWEVAGKKQRGPMAGLVKSRRAIAGLESEI
jgi:hypothetical protein